MAAEIISKRCPQCKQIKTVLEFCKNHTKKDGFDIQCKSCKKQNQQKYRKTKKGKDAQKRYKKSQKGKDAQKRYIQSPKGKRIFTEAMKQYNLIHPEYAKARIAVRKAIKKGKLPHPNTLQCHYGDHPAEQYHHHKGYESEHLLDVVPVCIKCHSLHKLNSSTGQSRKTAP